MGFDFQAVFEKRDHAEGFVSGEFAQGAASRSADHAEQGFEVAGVAEALRSGRVRRAGRRPCRRVRRRLPIIRFERFFLAIDHGGEFLGGVGVAEGEGVGCDHASG